MPDVWEALTVIGQRIGKDQMVRHMNDSPGTLFGIHPVANFNQTKFEDPDIDDVSPVITDLNPVSYHKRPSPEQEQPTRQTGNQVFQSNSQTGGDQSEKCGDGLNSGEPDPDNQEETGDYCNISDRLLPAITNLDVLGSPPNNP